MIPPVDPSTASIARAPLLVGREREQASLHHALDEMLAGHGSLVLVSGEAGIGKTTLVEWLAREAEAEGCMVLRGGCYDLTATAPYGPWVEALQAYLSDGQMPLPPAFVTDAEAFVSYGSQDVLFAELAAFFSRASEVRPLIVILDDLHWADQGSLAFLRAWSRSLRHRRVLALCTYRGEDSSGHQLLEQILPLLVREAQPKRISLAPIDRQAIRAFLTTVYAFIDTDTERLLDWLMKRSEGNPFFLHELTRTLEEQQVLVPAESGVWQISDLSQIRVPKLVRHVIEGRLRRLSERTRELLQVGAVLGRSVPVDLWQQVTGADDPTLIFALEQGQTAHLLNESANGDIWQFNHSLIRETLYEDLVSMQRRSWHRVVAEALELTPNPDPDQTAYHYQQARDTRAIAWLIRAAERAEHAYDWHTAVDRFEAALPLLAAGEDNRLRGWIQIHLARLLRSSDAQRGLRYSENAYYIAEQSDDRVLRTVALGVRGHLNCFVFNTKVGVEDMAAGVRAGEDLTDTEWLTSYRLQRSVLELCDVPRSTSEPPPFDVARITSEPVGLLVLWLVIGTLRLHEAIARGDDYAARLAGVDQQQLLRHTSAVEGASWVDTYSGLGHAYAALGRPSEASAAFDRALDLYRQAGHHVLAAAVQDDILTKVHLPYQTDDLEERDRLLQTAAALYGAGGGAMHADFSGEYLHTRSLYLAGRWEQARAFGEYALSYWRGSAIGFQEAPLGTLSRRQGHPEDAWHLIKERYPNGAQTRVAYTIPHYAMEAMRLAVDLALDDKDLVTAHEWMEAHSCWLEESRAVLGRAESTQQLARYHQIKGENGQARQFAEQALAHATDPRQPLALIAAHRFLGQLDTVDQRFEGAEAHLQESLRLADACAAPFERALTVLELAESATCPGSDPGGRHAP